MTFRLRWTFKTPAHLIGAADQETYRLLGAVLLFAASCGGLAGAQEAQDARPLLDVTVEVDFGPDEGQNLGSLFEVYDARGNVVAGAGFLGAYNTEPRSERGRVNFFLKPKRPVHAVEPLPRVNDPTGVYLSDVGETLYARARGARDRSFYSFVETTKTWRADPAVSGYAIRVAGKALEVGPRAVTYAGETVLTLGDGAPESKLRESYYAYGRLVARVQRAAPGDGSNRLIAYPWSPYAPRPVAPPGAAAAAVVFDPARAVAIELATHGEFAYAFGQLDGEILAATNTGGVYVFDGASWRALVEPGPHSYQVYSMINYYERLLLGHYPSGELYEYDGHELRHLPGWPPVLSGVSKRAREAQTLSIYGGDLYAGVWPWGEVWRYDHNASEWRFVRRMFTHPELSAAAVHPYEDETKAAGAVLNLWGQRVTSLTPFKESLYVGTSSKGGVEFDPKFAFLDAGRWKDYGRVYRLTLPGQLSAAVEWKDGPTKFRFTLSAGRMAISQDGRLQAALPVEASDVLDGAPRRVTWGRGVYGRLAGVLRARSSNLERPFLGAYLHLSELFRGIDSNDARERATDGALERFRDSGLRVVMPYVTSTAGTAAYPSRLISERQFDDWDALAYLTAAADARGLAVHPVFCVLACGHDEPAGILLKHPEWALRTPEGALKGHISPAPAAARSWVAAVVAEVVERYPIQGILLDYLRYPNRPTRLDAASEAACAEARDQQSTLSPEEFEQRFREQMLTRLARQIGASLRRRRPDVRIGVYSWGPHVAQNHRVAQPWPLWSRAGDIDMVNISGYCYPDNYGEKYLDVFSRRLGAAVELNRQHAGRADITFCLGLATSHGRIQAASWIDDYLSRAARERVTGVAMFTWSRFDAYLDEVNEREYLRRFVNVLEDSN